MTDSSLSRRLSKGEDAITGFVADPTAIPAIARAVCSFLNSSEGGTVFVGVDDQGKPTLKGPTLADAQAIEAALQAEISPSALYSVSLDPVRENASVFTIDVPPGSSRPYVVNGAVWVRATGQIEPKPAAAEDIRAMFTGIDQEQVRWERRISIGLEEADVDLGLVRRLRDKALDAGRLVLEEAETEMEMLRDLFYWRPKGFTNACDVLFARVPGRRLPQARVQLLEFPDKTADTYDDYRWFEGPAIETVDKIYEALQRHNKTRARFHEGSIERDEQPAYHDFPLREGIVNALAHRSYESYSGGVKVSIYPDRIEFWNTGQLPPEIDIKDLPKKHQSYPVNPDIAHAFYMNRFMDRTGRGAERIAEACKQVGAPPPVWKQDQGGVTLILYASLAPGEAVTQLNERQRTFLDTVAPGDAVSLDDYARRFASDISKRQARRELTELESYRFVRKEGQSVATVYRRLKS